MQPPCTDYSTERHGFVPTDFWCGFLALYRSQERPVWAACRSGGPTYSEIGNTVKPTNEGGATSVVGVGTTGMVAMLLLLLPAGILGASDYTLMVRGVGGLK